jgi:Domain of unknown function (DUF1905)
MKSKVYKFKADVWKYKLDGAAAWHFMTLPKEISAEIRFLGVEKKSPWGSLRVIATIGKTRWKTSLFPDAKSACYFLPIKADVRKAENLKDGSSANCKILRDV